MLLSPTSNLEFPSWRAPGFDPTHPAALNTRMSAVALTSGAAFLNLLTGTRPTVSLTNPSSLLTPFGPAMNLQSGYTYNQFPYVIETPTAFTFAATLTTYSFANPGGVISPNGSTNSGQRFMVNSGGTFEIAAGAANFGSACVSGHTYFIAVSYTSSVSNWVLVDLSTGVTKTHTAGGASGANANATIQVGANYSATYPTGANVMAAMYAVNNFLSPAQLRVWAADPWAFWYPDDGADYRIVGFASSGGLALVGAARSTFRGQASPSGAAVVAAQGIAQTRSQGAPALAAVFTARSKAAYAAKGASGTGAFFTAMGAVKALTTARAAASLTAGLSARSTAVVAAGAATGALARIAARSSAVVKANAQTTANGLLIAVSGVARMSFNAAAAIARLVFAPGQLLKAPLTTRVLKAPVSVRSPEGDPVDPHCEGAVSPARVTTALRAASSNQPTPATRRGGIEFAACHWTARNRLSPELWRPSPSGRFAAKFVASGRAIADENGDDASPIACAKRMRPTLTRELRGGLIAPFPLLLASCYAADNRELGPCSFPVILPGRSARLCSEAIDRTCVTAAQVRPSRAPSWRYSLLAGSNRSLEWPRSHAQDA